MKNTKRIAENIIEQLTASIAKNGTASLVVSGGSSPLAVFAELAAHDIGWDKVTITLVDDRLVPADHADSNQALLHRHLLVDHAAAARFMPLTQAVMDVFRPFDVMLLGMGPDGHFASLFPAMVGDDEAFGPDHTPKIITTPPIGSPQWPRISMNMAMILESNLAILLVNGAEKQAVLAASKTDSALPIHWLLKQTKRKIEVEIS